MDPNKPKFTVITATRNCLEFVGQCLRSVISQDYDNYEHLIMDDVSNDRTYERACEIAAKHPNMKVMRNDQRMHCGSTYNNLLKMASGDYCGVVDGDDVLAPGAISTVIKYYLANPKIDFIWTKHRWYNGKMSRYRNGISYPARRGTIFESEEGCRHIYSHWRTFKTKMRDRGRLFKPMKCTVDKELGYTLEELGHGAFLPLELYHYRYYPENMSHHSSQKAVWRQVRKNHAKRRRNRCVVLKV